VCGDNGCGGSCGTCPGGQSCTASGRCEGVCEPQCAGRECGADGCGGLCGECAPGETCDNRGLCGCERRAATACHEGDVWWFDSCGNPEAVVA